MSKSFIPNFKTLLLIVAKSASTDPDCPLAFTLMSSIIEGVFKPENDEENRKAYRLYRDKIKDKLEKKGSSVEKAIETRDRSIFDISDMLPLSTPETYKPYMGWYSCYLRERMPQKQVDTVFKYIKSLNSQV